MLRQTVREGILVITLGAAQYTGRAIACWLYYMGVSSAD